MINKIAIDKTIELIRDDWFLITAMKKDGQVNTMTAQWGTIGYLWGREIATIYIRPTRFTHEFIMESESFSISFFDKSYKEKLKYLGTVSGRDEDKIYNANLSIMTKKEAPYFKEASMTIVCKKIYLSKIDKNGFLDREIDKKVYGDNDYHTVIVGEIQEIF
ncbi:MAG: flavin reductase family protein [Tissierellia bacterium]|nr:flavin reductase family protein [Tissierellia bacterium]